MDQPIVPQAKVAVRHKKRRLVRLRKKHSLATRWFHWINFPVLGVMVWSGLLIYWSNQAYHLGSFSLFPEAWYDRFGMGSRLAEGMGWHFLFAWLFALNGLAYVLYTVFSGAWRELVPNLRSFGEAIHVVLYDLFLTRRPPPKAKFNAAQRIAYTGIIVMGFGSLWTGIGIYKPTQFSFFTAPFGGYQNTRFVHFWLTMGFCAFFLVHVVQVARAGWNNFRAMVTGYELEPVDE